MSQASMHHCCASHTLKVSEARKGPHTQVLGLLILIQHATPHNPVCVLSGHITEAMICYCQVPNGPLDANKQANETPTNRKRNKANSPNCHGDLVNRKSGVWFSAEKIQQV